MSTPPLTLSQTVQIDAAPRPVAYWAELWGRSPGTVTRWIHEGTCPDPAVLLRFYDEPDDAGKRRAIRGMSPQSSSDLGKQARGERAS